MVTDEHKKTMHGYYGKGTQHRKEISTSGQGFYLWIVNNNYPEGDRVLCMNCNFAIGHFGVCPHEKDAGV